MKITYLILADAASQGPEGKINVLGMGLRKFTPNSIPGLAPVVLLAGGEASSTDLGMQPIKVTLEMPNGKRRSIVDDTVEVKARQPGNEALPNEVTAQIAFPFLMEVEGIHVLRVQLGKARTTYPLVVTTPRAETSG